MAGKTGRSGGKRAGAGAKKKGDLVQLHAMIDLHVDDADWASIIGALVKKAKTGNVYAFRELRACRYGHLPIATEPVEDAQPPIHFIEVVEPCSRKHVDEETVRPAELSSKEPATPI